MNETPVPSTMTTLLHGDGTGQWDHSPTPSHRHNTYQQHSEVSTHPGIHQPLPDNIISLPWWVTGSTYFKYYTNNSEYAPLTFPNKQTFGDLLDHAKPNGHIQLAFCNVAGFPIDVYNNSKVQDLWAFQTQCQVDIFGGCKSNLN